MRRSIASARESDPSTSSFLLGSSSLKFPPTRRPTKGVISNKGRFSLARGAPDSCALNGAHASSAAARPASCFFMSSPQALESPRDGHPRCRGGEWNREHLLGEHDRAAIEIDRM